MADARKSLQVLYNEWNTCTKCELGKRREVVGGQFVFGDGVPKGILFVGEGPGKDEEKQGIPFVGKSGEVLRGVLNRLGVGEVYITNTVCCRSATPLIDQTTQQPILRKNYQTKQMEIAWKDEPPPPYIVSACEPRLMEEIYLVDPVVIVSLGGGAASALTGAPITITTERGKERHISIPGAAHRAVLTEKRGAWRRKLKGEWIQPTEQNQVRYLLIPTLHPSYVIRKLGDRGSNSPFRQFVDDIKKAAKIYERYMQEAFNITPMADVSDEVIEEYHQELEEGPTDE